MIWYIMNVSDSGRFLMSDKGYILESWVNLYVSLKVYFLIGVTPQHQEKQTQDSF